MRRLDKPRRLTVTDVDKITRALHVAFIDVVRLAQSRMA